MSGGGKADSHFGAGRIVGNADGTKAARVRWDTLCNGIATRFRGELSPPEPDYPF